MPVCMSIVKVCITLLFYQIETLKNGVTLILPSSIARNSSAPNAKIIFEILRGILGGLKIAKMVIFKGKQKITKSLPSI